MKELNDILKKHNIKVKSYKKIGLATIVSTNEKKYVVKKIKNKEVFSYLDSRSFNYYPGYIYDDNYLIMEYLDNESITDDEKILDLINLTSLLHNKTTFYSTVDIDDYKKDYETIKNRINYLSNHYESLISFIENKIYMSPSELLLARNISIIFGALNYSNAMIDDWYNNITDKTRRRYSYIHNNLDLSHFIRNNGSYLVSWDKSKRDIPIYDLYHLYKKYALSFDFKSLLKKYEKNYPLLDNEKKLLFVMISIPDEFNFTNNIYNDCVRIERIVDYLYKTESLVSPKKPVNGKENNNTN